MVRKKTSDNYSKDQHIFLKTALQHAIDLYSDFSLTFAICPVGMTG